MTALAPETFDLNFDGGVVTVTLRRPERLNALTFDTYEELSDAFAALGQTPEARAILITGHGDGFCSGGDVDEIIAQLFSLDAQGLLGFTRLTGRLIHNMRACRRPIIGAINGVAVGAGAVIAAACDLRVAAESARFGYIFPRVGLSGADMGASWLLPRIVGLGHASELLFLGEIVDAAYAARIGLVNRVVKDADAARALARTWAETLAAGPAFAHAMTKQMMESEHGMSLAQAIEAEAQAQALCMAHPDFRIAHEAFKARERPVYTGLVAQGLMPQEGPPEGIADADTGEDAEP
jgi:enoyl-CoA hydratase/carnithine racemase